MSCTHAPVVMSQYHSPSRAGPGLVNELGQLDAQTTQRRFVPGAGMVGHQPAQRFAGPQPGGEGHLPGDRGRGVLVVLGRHAAQKHRATNTALDLAEAVQVCQVDGRPER